MRRGSISPSFVPEIFKLSLESIMLQFTFIGIDSRFMNGEFVQSHDEQVWFGLRWRLNMFPNGRRKEAEGSTSLYLQLIDEFPRDKTLVVGFEFIITDQNGTFVIKLDRPIETILEHHSHCISGLVPSCHMISYVMLKTVTASMGK